MMPHYTISSLVLIIAALSCTAARAQGVINNGAHWTIAANTHVKIVQGGVLNQTDGVIDNNGTVYLDRDWLQTGAATDYLGLGWIWFENGTNQVLASVSPISIDKLRVDNGNKLLLGSGATVTSDVDLMNNSSIQLNTYNLILTPGASIYHYDPYHRIITNDIGFLQQQVTTTPMFFPLGNSTYNPVTLTNNGTTDHFQVRVEDQVWDQGTTGNIETSHIVNRTWHIGEAVHGGSNTDITVQWETDQEIGGFDRNDCAIIHWDGMAWDRATPYSPATAAGADTWTQTRTEQTAFSPFVVEDIQLPLPIELLHFEAQRLDIDRVLLEWATASEQNNAGFEIQRRLDQQTEFSTVGFVEGYGNSTSTIQYRYHDNNAYPQVSYYRLRQIDHDGTFAYSAIRAVVGTSATDATAPVVLYPNPADDIVHLRFGELANPQTDVQIRIIDMRGALVQTTRHRITPYQSLTLPIGSLPAAAYWVKIQMESGEHQVLPLIKRH